ALLHEHADRQLPPPRLLPLLLDHQLTGRSCHPPRSPTMGISASDDDTRSRHAVRDESPCDGQSSAMSGSHPPASMPARAASRNGSNPCMIELTNTPGFVLLISLLGFGGCRSARRPHRCPNTPT